MKLRITMKDADALYIAAEEALNEQGEPYSADEQEEARQAARKWMRWGEYLDVEIDTEAGTATLLEVRK